MNAITALQRIWNGTQWVKAIGDDDGRIMVQPRRRIWIPQVVFFNVTNISPGSVQTVTDQSNVGTGRIYGMHVYVNGGDWGSSRGALIRLTIDGVLVISQPWEVLFNAVHYAAPFQGVYTAVNRVDTTNYAFSGEMLLNAEFAQGFILEIQNQSTTQNIERCTIHLLWGYYQEV